MPSNEKTQVLVSVKESAIRMFITQPIRICSAGKEPLCQGTVMKRESMTGSPLEANYLSA